MSEFLSVNIFYGNDIRCHHWHTSIELLYVLQGQLILCIDGKKAILEKNSFAIIPSGCLHFTCGISASCSAYNIVINPNALFEDLNDIYIMRYENPFVTNPKLCCNVLSIMEGYKKKSSLFDKHFIYDIFCVLDVLPHYLSTKSNKKQLNKFQELITYIKNNLIEDWSIEKAAEFVFLSPNYFSASFKELTSLSFTKYVQLLRIEKAISLLDRSDLNFLSISYECGFGSLRSFNRVFKNITGATPSDYANKKQI